METTLGKLQKQITKLEKDNLKLRELLAIQKEKNISLKNQIKYLESTMEKKINDRLKQFEETILKENEILRAENEKLRRLLNTNSDNSGVPTSKTAIGDTKRIPNSREKSELKKGGQVGHKKHKLEKFKDEEVTDTIVHQVMNCTCGCQKLKDLGIRTIKDLFDIDIRLIKARNEFHNYQCMECGKIIESPVPLNLKEDNQYGTNAQAIAVSLVNEGCVSFKRTRELISGFTGGEMNLSEGYIAKLQKKCHKGLEEFDKELHQQIIKEKVLNWDDTAIVINGKQACLRFYGTESLAYYKAHEKKNKQGLDEDEILQYLDKDTVVVHDHNKVNYNDNYDFTNAECCVHLIRDLKKLNESLPRTWIDNLIKLLIETNNKRKEYINDSIMYFDQEVTDKVSLDYDNIIKEAKDKNKNDFNKYYGHEEQNLIKRLEKYKENYLLWVIRFDVPFTNNLSERSLRSSKTKMKVSGQFANIENARYYARIKSYIETCKRNGLNEHIAIVKLLDGNPYTINDILNPMKND